MQKVCVCFLLQHASTTLGSLRHSVCVCVCLNVCVCLFSSPARFNNTREPETQCVRVCVCLRVRVAYRVQHAAAALGGLRHSVCVCVCVCVFVCVCVYFYGTLRS